VSDAQALQAMGAAIECICAAHPDAEFRSTREHARFQVSIGYWRTTSSDLPYGLSAAQQCGRNHSTTSWEPIAAEDCSALEVAVTRLRDRLAAAAAEKVRKITAHLRALKGE